jgi:hypothetical protein
VGQSFIIMHILISDASWDECNEQVAVGTAASASLNEMHCLHGSQEALMMHLNAWKVTHTIQW